MKHKFESYYLDSPLVTGRVFDVFEPEEITKDVAIFIVHGGGWRGGTRTLFHEIMQAFSERGYIIASTDYRLNAKDAFEQIKDIRESYDRFVSILKEKNRPLKIAVYGESAGSHLASLLVCAKPGECGEEVELKNEWVMPHRAMLHATPADFLYWEDMIPSFWDTMQDIAGAPYEEDPERYERLSLKNYIGAHNPPIFFIEAELEELFLSEHTLKFAKKHREVGIKSHWKVYPKMEHGFFYSFDRQAQKDAFEDICLFLEDKLETEF